MQPIILSKDALKKALSIRDLSNPDEGPHAIQLLIKEILDALGQAWNSTIHIYRDSPIVSISDNYDALHYPPEGLARTTRYTRYVCDTALLRTSTSALIPKAMRALSGTLTGDDVIACPGLVYRRDSIDRLHLSEIHQIDLWRISRHSMGRSELAAMIGMVLGSILPDHLYRCEPRTHPYTQRGLQIDVLYENSWIEVGECGLAHPAILAENLPAGKDLSGLAMGLGLDRLLMIRKGISDIRLIASEHPKIAPQMLNLDPYDKVSAMPAVVRDLSIVIDREADLEELGARVREALGADSELVAEVAIKAESQYENLPKHVIQKLGIVPTQKNVLLTITFQALDRTLTDEACNRYRNLIYKELHEGKREEWA